MPLPLGLPPADPGFELFFATTGMSQGIAQTERVQVRPRFLLSFGNAQFSAQWRNIDSPAANGVGIFSVKYSHTIGRARLEGVVAYRVRTGARASLDKTAWEFTGTARRSFEGWAAHAEVQYSPDEFGTGTSLYLESGVAVEIASSATFSLNVARREREKAPDYSAVNFGISTAAFKKLSLDARLFTTDRSHLGAPYRSRQELYSRRDLRCEPPSSLALTAAPVRRLTRSWGPRSPHEAKGQSIASTYEGTHYACLEQHYSR